MTFMSPSAGSVPDSASNLPMDRFESKWPSGGPSSKFSSALVVPGTGKAFLRSSATHSARNRGPTFRRNIMTAGGQDEAQDLSLLLPLRMFFEDDGWPMG
ncbi:hypothetical protein JTB14_002734 [Gonioctena quinquepunctata]|nr:hypothetical protein JTB14_002734 [Gonioctena quinquepunctata]